MQIKIIDGHGWADLQTKVNAWLATFSAPPTMISTETRMHMVKVGKVTTAIATMTLVYK